jgi:peptide chain release factor 1
MIDQKEAGDIEELLQEEIDDCQTQNSLLEKELLALLAPSDDRDQMDVYLEIRAGAGGDESAIFAADLLRMYTGLCGHVGLKIKVISISENTVGGYKEVICEVKGENAFFWFKHEGGVHRVQRVPATEKQGRIHTSTTSVAIMPMVDKNNNFQLDLSEVDIIGQEDNQSIPPTLPFRFSTNQLVLEPSAKMSVTSNKTKSKL